MRNLPSSCPAFSLLEKSVENIKRFVVSLQLHEARALQGHHSEVLRRVGIRPFLLHDPQSLSPLVLHDERLHIFHLRRRQGASHCCCCTSRNRRRSREGHLCRVGSGRLPQAAILSGFEFELKNKKLASLLPLFSLFSLLSSLSHFSLSLSFSLSLLSLTLQTCAAVSLSLFAVVLPLETKKRSIFRF